MDEEQSVDREEGDKKLFFQLLQMLNVGVIQNLGLMKNPMTEEKEQNLSVAKNTIEMLEMLRRKTAGRLDEEETEALEEVISNGQMLYVKEKEKDDEGE